MPRYRLGSLLLCLAAVAGPAATAAQTPADETWDEGDLDRARARWREVVEAGPDNAEALTGPDVDLTAAEQESGAAAALRPQPAARIPRSAAA